MGIGNLKTKLQPIIHFVIYFVNKLFAASKLITIFLFCLSLASGLMVMLELWSITHFIDQIAWFTGWNSSYGEVFQHFARAEYVLPSLVSLKASWLQQYQRR